MEELHLEHPHHVTAGYVGVPGERTFYVQAEDEHHRVTILVEKGQVQGIGELLAELLDRVDDEPSTDWDRNAMALREPLDPQFRAGQIGAGVDPQLGRFVLEVHELTAEEDDEPGAVIRLSMNQDQARRLAAHAIESVGEGRPRCGLCGRPIETDGSHVCPSTNGHGQLTV